MLVYIGSYIRTENTYICVYEQKIAGTLEGIYVSVGLRVKATRLT